MAEKKYISKIKLQSDDNTYDITLTNDQNLNLSGITTTTMNITTSNVTTTYTASTITVNGVTLSLPSHSGTFALKGALPTEFNYDVIED